MARTPKFEYRAALERELQGHAEGITLDQILERSGLAADRTTLFRHLSRLIQEGKVERIGKARASRYRLIAAAPVSVSITAPEPPAHSPEAAAVQGLIERYQPNLTPYLQDAELARLRKSGSSQDPNGAPGAYAARVFSLLGPELCHASARLAGCGYSAAETEALLEHGAILQERDPSEAVVILNHREALHQVVDAVSEIDLTGQQLLRLHATLGKNLPIETLKTDAGTATGDKDHLPALADAQAVERLAAKLLQIKDPFEQAFCALLFLTVSTAFAGGDRGASRIAVNIPLLKHALCPLSFIGVETDAWNSAVAAAVKAQDAVPLKQLFVAAYLRGADRYRDGGAQAEVLPPPMPDYSAAIKKAVRTIVRDWKRCNRINLEIYLSLLVGKEHLQTVAAAVERELAGLHQGNLADFALTPAEFACFTPPVALARSEAA